ncbi:MULTISPECIES: AMP-binding protein [Rhodococcus]|uniref:Acyl-CoA-ligase/synthetase n=1 Tax=Rhodococcus opacus RKJ300 = JCM 13270 TaxID=1165867 RepID=I0WTQ9_RHOOP|nr:MULTISPECIES: AMP-binding protein [Rhodococcus]EID79775.1 acyl-CoA-ligase/synthetase [Rhodococcus opacus RKJ300 = JCM 13270]KAF0961814.1 putative sulfoacetate--CoA ligase [Rhodococcus sp. T7]QQZ18264.1 AMP-binding protein [Rhodococcus sp. 21391]UOT08200.1 AMP-binding protein [Rhodococcus opacus]
MTDDIQTRVRRLITGVNTDSAHLAVPADPRVPLTGLDSLTLVELVVQLEKEFAITIAAELITTESFGSVSGIAEVVRASGARAAGVHDYRPGGKTVPPTDGTVVDVLRRRATDTPDAPFLTWLPTHGDAEVLTYGALNARSRAIASNLAEGKYLCGERVGLLAANDIDTVLALFAVIRAGGTCLVLNPTDPPQRLRQIIAAYPIRTVLCSPYVTGIPEDLARPIPVSTPGSALEDTAVDQYITPGGPAFMFSTSGSTAASKLVLQSHRALLSNAQGLKQHHDLGPGVTIAGGLPLHHVNGVHFTVVAVLNAGAHVVLPQQFSPLTYRSQLETYRPQIASVVPSMLEALLVTGRGWRPPDTLRYFVSAAAPLTASLAKRIMNAFGLRVIQGYGLTETTNFSTMLPIDLADDDYAALVLNTEIPTVGVAFPGNELEVLSVTGDVLAEGEIGEVCMRGHNVMECYVDAPDQTSEAFAGDWFHSGDLGRWIRGRDDRRYFILTGRLKNIAQVRGEAVSLEEVEHALLSLDSVVDAGCLAQSHPLWGEEIVAMVVLRDADIAEIRTQLAALLPPTALPRRWQQVDSVPRTPTGKLQRALLRDQLSLDTSQ